MRMASIEQASAAFAHVGRVATVTLVIVAAPVSAFAQDTETVGGPGGGAYRIQCAFGSFLVGLTGRAGEWMDQVAPICVPIGPTGRWMGTPSPGASAGGSGGGSFTTMCARDSVVTGFQAYAGTYVFNIGLMCRHAGPNGPDYRQASPPLVGGSLGIGSSAGGYCPAVHAANGVIGRAGLFVDRFGLSCAGYIDETPVPGTQPPPPPLAICAALSAACGVLETTTLTLILR